MTGYVVGAGSGYVIGADVGTSALKAVLVHAERGVVAAAEHAYPMDRPEPGWAQNDPEDWYRALRYVTLTDVQLAHPPAVVPMVLAGVRGPKSLAMSGQHADGTILAEPVTPAYVEFARSHLGDTSEHHIVAYNVAAVDDDQRRARERVRAALWWAGEPAWAPEIAPLPFAAELASLRLRAGSAAEFTRRLPGAWIDQLALVGSPATVRDRLAGLRAAGAGHLVMSPVGDDPVGEISQLARVLQRA